MNKEDFKKIKELKEDIELIKLSITCSSGIGMSIDDFEKGRYGERDKIYFKKNWKELKERAKRLNLL